MKGKKPKATKLEIIEGNPSKRPLKKEPDVSSDIPTPPDHLDAYAREEWERLAPGLHVLGLLYQVDRAVFAAYCAAYSRWRTAEEALQEKGKLRPGGASSALTSRSSRGSLTKSPYVRISEESAKAMVKYAAEFGFTPSARARLAVSPAGEGGKGKFDGLIGQKDKD